MRFRFLALGVASFAFGLVAACSTFGEEDTDDPANPPQNPPANEGGTEAQTTTDSAPDPRCTADVPFGAPELVPSLNQQPFHSLSARPAGPFLYFTSDREGPSNGAPFANADVWRASFMGDTFTEVRRMANLSTVGVEDVAPTESADAKTLFLASGTLSTRKIKVAERGSTLVDYPPPKGVAGETIVAAAVFETDPYVVGNHLYFVSQAGTPGALSLIYETDLPTLPTPRVAIVPAAATKLRYPVVNATETELYYYSFDEIDSKVWRAYVARRSSPSGPFSDPKEIPQLQFAGAENVNLSALSPNGCDIYVAARFAAGFDIYRARRVP